MTAEERASRDLLDPRFLARLERLELNARRVLSGELRGDTPSARKGAGTVFRGHRAYVPGDDPRFLDWNAYLRLGDLVIKEFQAEETPRIVFFLDRSASMGLGGGERFRRALRLAAALGYVGLCRHATVGCVGFPGDGRLPLFQGRSALARFLEHLSRLEPQGETRMLRTLKEACPPGRPTGLAVVISDFFETRELGPAFRFLVRRGFVTHALHLVSPEDLEPVEGGLLELEDVESGRSLRQRITPGLARAYLEAVQRHFHSLEQTCRELRVSYHRLQTSITLEETVIELLRKGALLR